MRRQRSKYFYSEEEIDFSLNDLDYEKFLIQEFFTLDYIHLQEAFIAYQNRHGKLSLQYLQRNFSDWKNGNYHLTPLMRERITSLVLDFLSEEAKWNLSLHQFISIIKRVVRDYHPFYDSSRLYNGHSYTTIKSWRELKERFNQEIDRIGKIKRFFTSYDFLPDKHVEEAVEIGKSILRRKAKEKFGQIKRDLLLFHPYIQKFKRQSLFLYRINDTNLTLNVSQNNFFEDFGGDLEVLVSKYSQKYKVIVEKFLAQELVVLNRNRKLERQSYILGEKDLETLWEHYSQLLEGTYFTTITSEFQGAGGKLEITIEVKPKKLLKYAIADKLMKVLILALAFSIIFKVIFEVEHTGIIFILVMVGVSLFGFLLSKIGELKEGILEFNKYGK